jgi:hypothetical protein
VREIKVFSGAYSGLLGEFVCGGISNLVSETLQELSSPTPIEFTRQSADGRITLVIDSTASPVRLMWAHMLSGELQSARKALRDREGIKRGNWASKIASWRRGQRAPAMIPALPKWAEARGLDAAIWTALGPKFEDAENIKKTMGSDLGQIWDRYLPKTG